MERGESAKPGQTLLIHGGSGGVGVASIQLAKSRGITVFATAGTEAGLDLIIQQGASQAFNHREDGYIEKIKEITNGRGVDLILENLANVNLDQDLKLLAKRGKILVVGNRGTINIDPRVLMSIDGTINGIALGNAS